MKLKFLNQNKFFEWKYGNYWKPNHWINTKATWKKKIKTKIQIIESMNIYWIKKRCYWINIPLLHKHSVVGYKPEFFEWIKMVVEWNCWKNWL